MKRSMVLASLVAASSLFASVAAEANVFFTTGGNPDLTNGVVSLFGATTFNFDTTIPTFDNPVGGGGGIFGPGSGFNGTTQVAAAPFGDSTRYGSVGSINPTPASATILAPTPSTYFGIYLGSVDPYNTITITEGTGMSAVSTSFTGTQLFNPNVPVGNQGLGGSEYINFFSNGGTISSVTISSSMAAAEFDNLTFATPAPEASTWAMMILGFLGLGFLGYRKSSKTSHSSFRLA